jgi:hypothetical protein
LGLILPVAIPVLLSVLIVLLMGVPFTHEHWIRTALLMGISLLYFTFFAMLGVFVSALTRKSSVSFLLSLVAWIALVLIIPRAGVMAAGQLVRVPTVAELDGRVAAYSRDRWAKYMDEVGDQWEKRRAPLASMNSDDRKAYEQQHEWEWMEQDDAARNTVQKDIDQQSVKFTEDMRNRKQEQVRLGLTLSRFSPASAFQLAAMQLAGTDVDLKTRYEDAMQSYRQIFNAYREKKERDSGGSGGIRIRVDSDKGFSFSSPRDAGTLDLSDMPLFSAPKSSLQEYVAPTFVDIGLLVVLGLSVFAGAFVAFLRYDVR